MKIAYTGLDLPEGKTKYDDPVLNALVEHAKPDKVSPYYFELLPDAYEESSATGIHRNKILDLLIHDIEKIESRLSRCEDDAEKAVLEKCLAQLEDEKPVCDLEFDQAERRIVNAFGPLSFKATVVFDETPALPEFFRAMMKKAGVHFFYTSGKQEVRAWFVKEGADAVTCAEQIHSDLARGFIKAEIIPYEQLLETHSFQDARSKGLTKLVDRDYVIEPNTVLEIRFNV